LNISIPKKALYLALMFAVAGFLASSVFFPAELSAAPANEYSQSATLLPNILIIQPVNQYWNGLPTASNEQFAFNPINLNTVALNQYYEPNSYHCERVREQCHHHCRYHENRHHCIRHCMRERDCDY
jgi:hypothetical protein